MLKQGDAAYDHAGGAVGALKSFGVEEGLLDGMEAAGLLEAFDGGDRLSDGGGYWSDAGAAGHSVEEYRAGAALTFTAAVFRSGEANAVSNYREQGCFSVDYDGMRVAIDVQIEALGHRTKKSKAAGLS